MIIIFQLKKNIFFFLLILLDQNDSMISYDIKINSKQQTTPIMNFYQNRNLIMKGQSENIGNLWLGDYQSARNKRSLKADGINAVVTAGLGMKISYNSEFRHKLLPLYDHEAEDIQRFFEASYDFIDEALKFGNVLVHCYAGVSRSTTILAAYLMKKNNWAMKDVLAMIKKQRRFINPNRGFTKQLRRFDNELKGVNPTDLSEKIMPGKQKNYLERVRLESRKGRQSMNLGRATFQANKFNMSQSQRAPSSGNKMSRSINPILQMRSKTLQKQKKI